MIWQTVTRVLISLALALCLLGWLSKLSRPRRKHAGKRPSRISRPDCQRIPANFYRRPDPLIYDQYYLMARGLAITWDNPDISVQKAGKVVDAHNLEPGTEYDIIARVWNSSNLAPVAGLPVRFSYLSFGIGAAAHPIGATTVNLGVKGSLSCPAFAHHVWKTPGEPGHYCLQVELEWFDDAEPANNLGQHNTIVKALNSPMASFAVPIFNIGKRRRTFRLQADEYSLPPLSDCRQSPPVQQSLAERITSLTRTHGYQDQRGIAGWDVKVEPQVLDLEPGGEATVTVVAVAPDDYRGRQAINLNAFTDNGLIGGVTLYATSGETE
jgi:hypothetical protein